MFETMKIKKIFTGFAALIFAVSACNTLDITPDGRMGLKEVFTDEIKTEAYLNTVYGSIPTYFYRYQFWTFLAGITDEGQDVMVGVESTNMSGQWISGALTTQYNPLAQAGQGRNNDHYPAFWSGIRNANVFLENIDGAKVKVASRKSRFKSEAQLLRAFYYLELVKQYGPVPVVDKPFDNTFDYKTLLRPSFQENVDFIVKDCDEAIANPDLPMRIAIGSERGRFTKAIAYAIKSQALLYSASPLWNPSNDAAKWQAAALASKTALDILTTNGYALAPDYGEYFLNTSDINTSPIDKESIFEIPEEMRNEFSVINSIPSKAGMVKAGVCPSQEFVDSYDMQKTGEPAITGYSDADHLQPIINKTSGYDEANPYVGRDPRFYATIWYNGAKYDNIGGAVHTMETFVGGADQLIKTPTMTNTRSGYYLRKFIDPKIPVWQDKNARWKKFRLAEIYLNYAEAENEANGPTAAAYKAINTIRARVAMPALPAGLTKDQLRERIRRERRVELAIEEHRFWDVRRWKILDQTDKLVTGMEITKGAGNVFTYKRFVSERRNAWQDKYRVFPIPIGDASNIPDFSKNQNAGW